MTPKIVRGLGALLLGLAAVAVPVVTTPASAAYSYEWDDGVASDGPIGGSFICVNNSASGVCYRADGDVIYVQDLDGDGFSAVARWYTDYGRWGTCRNSRGAGKWAACDKNFAEGQLLYFRSSQYDGDTQDWAGPTESELRVAQT